MSGNKIPKCQVTVEKSRFFLLKSRFFLLKPFFLAKVQKSGLRKENLLLRRKNLDYSTMTFTLGIFFFLTVSLGIFFLFVRAPSAFCTFFLVDITAPVQVPPLGYYICFYRPPKRRPCLARAFKCGIWQHICQLGLLSIFTHAKPLGKISYVTNVLGRWLSKTKCVFRYFAR